MDNGHKRPGQTIVVSVYCAACLILLEVLNRISGFSPLGINTVRSRYTSVVIYNFMGNLESRQCEIKEPCQYGLYLSESNTCKTVRFEIYLM